MEFMDKNLKYISTKCNVWALFGLWVKKKNYKTRFYESSNKMWNFLSDLPIFDNDNKWLL